MNQPPRYLKLLFLRHGKTAYTGKEKDLTLEGELHVRQVAKDFVDPWLQVRKVTYGDLAIVSSPSPRAEYTAKVVAEVLGYKMPIMKRDELQPTIWRDPVRALAACEGLSGKGYIDYETEPAFADPTVFEPHDEVKKRSYSFFSEYIRSALQSGPTCAIFVSHYEVFSPLVRDVFGVIASEATALRHVEPISLSVCLMEGTDRVILSGFFRNLVAAIQFDLSDCSFHRFPVIDSSI